MTLPIIRRLSPALLALLWSPLLAAAPPPRSLQDARKEIAVRKGMESARSRLRAEAQQRRLAARGGAWAISGTVRSSLDASPVGDVNVSIYDERGSLLGTTATFPDGTYSFSALVDGTYHVQADGSPVHVSDGIHTAAGGLPCPGFCDPTGGDPVVVSGAGASLRR